ncbi:Protein of unknown function [Actinacidiphila alni]|uniref:DUF4232 domain-containing protein n=1 Tax=Actinacidiphila alni TaxID=380248 RepID=A0A1I2JHX3_9ACTN|nr:DUF4232 domain-containing protein [Actinacidiphila alni]SFF52767.1 Protein of unknown function [Actinacidiphila alni]
MSTTRTSRSRTRTGVRLAGAAASAALAALALTACGGGSGDGTDKAAADISATTPTSPASPTKAPAPQPSATTAKPAPAPASASKKPPTRSGAPSKAPAPANKPVTCDGSNTKTVAAPIARPVNHLLLTVTNTGSRTCYLYAYPALRFGEAQAVPPAIEDSHPQAVVTLNPGESGYASVRLSAADGTGTHGYTEHSLIVHFYDRSLSTSTPSPAQPPLPAKGVHVDDSLTTTYWQQSLSDALTW